MRSPVETGRSTDVAGQGALSGPAARPASAAGAIAALAATVARKVGLALLTVWITTILIFVGVEILPQDPALHALGHESTLQQRAAFRHMMHLDDPPLQRYVRWATGMVHGDFGTSVVNSSGVNSRTATGAPIREALLPRLRYTAILALSSLLLGIAIALPLAVLSAQHAGKAPDLLLSVFAIAISALPEFVLAIVLLLIFAAWLKILPVFSGGIMDGDIASLALPSLTLGLAVAAYTYRIARVSVIETLSAPYVRTAVLHGLSPRRVLWRHVMPNAGVVVVNVVALNAIYMLGGVIVIENVFSYPGLGTLLVNAISGKDLPTIEGVAVLTAVLLVAINLAADAVVLLLDPRLRTRR